MEPDEIIVISQELLERASAEEREAYFQYLIQEVKRVDQWEPWLKLLFPHFATRPFSEGHKEFWEWVWEVELENKPNPWVSIWPRGHAKSTSAELAVTALAARGKRKYGLFICETQDQADDHVANITAMLESPTIELAYPDLGRPAMNKQGQSKGWRRNRIVTASGFILDACGLDSAARGIKFEAQRPDFMVFDDLDGELDTENITQKKIKIITQKLLPAGAPNCATLMVQNLVHENSIFARLCSEGKEGQPEPADFLRTRIVSGPIPAVTNMEVEEQETELDDGRTVQRWVITAGTATWPEGFPIEVCEALINEFGLTAFLAECQHQTQPPDGQIFSHLTYAHCSFEDLPKMKRVVVWIDPAVTSTDSSDSMGIQVDGLGSDNKIYRLWSWEQRSTPYAAVKRAIEKAIEYDAEVVGIETNQGGVLWRTVYDQAMEDVWRTRQEKDPETGLKPKWFKKVPRYKEKKATTDLGSKITRAERMLVDYERFIFVHVEGTHMTLEKALKRFPKVKPLDLVDACLVPETMILTPFGQSRLDEISVGDLVLTRDGYHPVSEVGQTGTMEYVYEITTLDGHHLIGTWDHPVYTEEEGWVPLALTTGLSVIVEPCPMTRINHPLFSIGAVSIGETPTPRNEAIGFTSTPPVPVPAPCLGSMSRCTSTTMVSFHRDTTSITETTTPSTTTTRTLSCSPEQNIVLDTGALGKTPKPWPSTLLPSGPWPRCGMRQTKAENGTLPMAEIPGSGEKNTHSSALGVHLHSPLWSARPDSVPSVVETRNSKPTPPTRIDESAPDVGHPSWPNVERRRSTVASRVVTVRMLGRSDVWNLEVDGPHEFFANGVLVHNCYWSWQELAGPLQRRRMKLSSAAKKALGSAMGVQGAPTRPIGL